MREWNTDYDSEPVTYCAKCYSLKIRHEDAIDADCCAECGCSDTLSTSISTWEKLYEGRYGKKYVEKSNDITNSPMFQLSIGKLKMKVYDCPKWHEVIRTLYPRFPRGLSKADSIILLFDRLSKDNRINDLRKLLLKYYKN